MATPVYTPRVNNNDDIVQVVAVHVTPGDEVRKGDMLAEVETDKSVVTVEAEADGFVLELSCEVDAQADVGSVLMWLGSSPDEAIPELAGAGPVESEGPARRGRPTAKATAMLRRYGLDADEVPASGERLSAADVEEFARRRGLDAGAAGAPRMQERESVPDVAGELVPLAPVELGMLHTVSWHRDRAASAYLEIDYDPAPWDRVAAEFGEARGLMMSPLLPLMAYRLVALALERPTINSTIVGEQRYQYATVNLGFTVQAGEVLYLTVMQDAGSRDADGFVEAMGQLQRHAMGHKLKPEESQGATLSFSSMARWRVTRHMPILPPSTALMVAHAATGADGRAVLGASYDHRVLSGFDVVRLLNELAKAPEAI